jgi:hypothetical protein
LDFNAQPGGLGQHSAAHFSPQQKFTEQRLAAPESPAIQFSGAHLFDLFAIGKQAKATRWPMAASVPDWDTEDDDRDCYVTIFAGPAAEQRARTYYEAPQTKRLPTIRAARVASLIPMRIRICGASRLSNAKSNSAGSLPTVSPG